MRHVLLVLLHIVIAVKLGWWVLLSIGWHLLIIGDRRRGDYPSTLLVPMPEIDDWHIIEEKEGETSCGRKEI